MSSDKRCIEVDAAVIDVLGLGNITNSVRGTAWTGADKNTRSSMEPVHQPKAPSNAHLSGFDPSPLFSGGQALQFGEANLIVGGSARQVLGRMAACVLNFLKPDGIRYIRGVTLLAPPQSVWDFPYVDVHRMLLQGLEDVHCKSMPAEQVSSGRVATRFPYKRKDSF